MEASCENISLPFHAYAISNGLLCTQKNTKLLVKIHESFLSQAFKFYKYLGLIRPYSAHDLRLVMNLMFNVVNVMI